MTGWTHTVGNPDDFARMLARLGDTPMPYTVTVKMGEERRRDRQNRFAFEAYRQIARLKGDRTPEDVRAESKLCVGVPILRSQDADFRAKYDRLIRPLDYADKLDLMVEPIAFPVTSLMTVHQMAEYITGMLTNWDRQGASVMLPEYDL